MTSTGEPMVDVRFRLALPTTSSGRELFALGVNVRVTTLHVLIGGALAAWILWLVLRKPRPTAELADAAKARPVQLRSAGS